MLMNSKTGIAFSIIAIAAVIALLASGPLAATKAQAFPFGGFHRGFGFHHFGFGFHRGFGFGFPGWGWGGGWGGGCGGCF
ncbi:MAG TPA: hypothetical protein VEH06_05115 [Candidatus Bathyarchaeia archaeon]|nr:hypothetical protein [Candidatus Bathyarchaeia archaeon]